jgi:hypothetical protein
MWSYAILLCAAVVLIYLVQFQAYSNSVKVESETDLLEMTDLLEIVGLPMEKEAEC